MNRLRVAILGIWIAGLATLLIAGRYSLFIRAELWPLLLATTVMFGLLLVAMISRIGKAVGSVSPAAVLQGAMLMLPLAYMASTATGSAASGLNSFALQKRSLGVNNVSAADDAAADPASAGDAGKLVSLNYIARHAKRLADTEVVTEGRVYRDESLPPGQAMIFRFVVVCCAADATPVQVLLSSPDVAGLKTDDWVRVKGTLRMAGKDGGTIPAIEASHVEQISVPPDPYLGPS